MGIKDYKTKEIVWLTKKEEYELLKFMDEDIAVKLAPNYVIRYFVAHALKDLNLRKRHAERINLLFEELRQTRKEIVKCCELCEYTDSRPRRDDPGINKHRAACEKYALLVKQRLEKLITGREMEREVAQV